MGNKILKYNIGKSVSEARKRKGYTQEQLAEMLGTQQPSISRIERGQDFPTVAFLKKIADCLQVELMVSFN